MELNLKGKRVLVTGASKGIGRACVELLSSKGCTVLGASRSVAPGPAAKEADLSQRGAAEELAAWAGDLDILVNNAGAIPGGDLQGVDEETWRKAWDLKPSAAPRTPTASASSASTPAPSPLTA